ncbi:TetR/AcrR family transcriptional regulator [Pelagibius sp. Alg239-R121]|uniref:TetR/AcrR family transcriptional regulator n=1 Tax=Pelagibius sp. Alg239-R121 TaxID=2993448 RepID=UPI0024A70339|nr:TetR/AcrR family transcriptional regulator [Pelagibius sp. Alg239-R121]
MTYPEASGRARRRRADAMRDVRTNLLVEAAKRVFSDMGLEGATMRAIAAEAGCTTGAIYPYFEGKEELYAAVLSRTLSVLKERVAAAVLREPETSRQARAALQAFFDHYHANPDDLALGLYLFGGMKPAGLSSKLNRALNKQLREVFDLVEAAFATAGKPDPAGTTASAIAQATGLLILEQTGRLRLFKKRAPALFADYVNQI